MLNRALLPALLLSGGLLAAAAVPSAGEETSPEDLPGLPVVVAGTGERGYSGDGGAAPEARLNDRLGIAVGPDGAVYIADRSNKRVRVVTPDGLIDTVPGSLGRRSPETDGISVPELGTFSPSNAPIATAVGPDGSLFVAANQDIRRYAPDGTVTVIAGAGGDQIRDGDPDGGAAVDAYLHEPSDIAVDEHGMVYVADTGNHRIRRIGPDGIITTIAGGGEDHPGSAEGQPGSSLDVYSPTSVAVDSRGSVYFTTELDGSVYEIDPVGNLHVIDGEDIAQIAEDAPATDAALVGGRHLAVDRDDNLYMTDPGNSRLRMLGAEDDLITTVAPLPADAGDIAIGPDGAVHVGRPYQVMRLTGPATPASPDDPPEPAGSPWPDAEPGELLTVAGVALDPDMVPEPVRPDDPATGPARVAVGPDGAGYVSDTRRNIVQRVDPDGTVTTLAGTGEGGDAGGDGPATAAQLTSPAGLDVDAEGNVYVADAGNTSIRRVSADGRIATIAGSVRDGTEDPGPACAGGPAAEDTLMYPVDVAVGPDGSVYIADRDAGLVCRVGPDGLLTRFAGGGELWSDDADGEPAVEASLWEPAAVDVDAAGNVYIIEEGRPYVRMVRPDGVLVPLVADSYYGQDEGGFSGDGGPALEAELNAPEDLAVAPDGGLYIADTFNARLRHVGADGVITTVAGTGSRHADGDGGPAVEAGLSEPSGVDVGPGGELLVASRLSDLVRRVGAEGGIETLADLSTPERGDEPLDEAELSSGMSLAVAPDGTLVVAEPQALRLRAVQDGTLTDLTAGGQELMQLGAVATGPGGELYAVLGQTVVRVHPDGRSVVIAGGQTHEQPVVDGAPATTQTLSPGDIAIGPEGTVFLLDTTNQAVYEVRHDGTIETVHGYDDITFAGPAGLAVGGDGTVYVTDASTHLVFAAAPGEAAEIIGGNGEDVVYEDGNGDGGPAREAVIAMPGDIVVDAEDNVFVQASGGVRRIDPDGTVTSVLPPGEAADRIVPQDLALGPGGDLYLVDSPRRQVLAVVRPGEVSSGGFPWITAGLGAAGVVVLAGAGVVLIRRRRSRAADRGHATA